MSKQKGYISWKQLVEGEMWADLLIFETMDDAQNVMKTSSTEDFAKNAFAHEFFSFIDQESAKIHLFSVQKSY